VRRVPSELPEDYFSTGHWAADGPLRLRTLTCLGCGTRLATWSAFRAHRRRCAAAVTAETLVPDPVETAEGDPVEGVPAVEVGPAAAGVAYRRTRCCR